MRRLGITGGIGSGKSYVARLLSKKLEVPVYDCDREARRLNEESLLIRCELTRLVGPAVYDERGLVKSVLARFLFSSDEHAKAVSAIVHPVVRLDFLRWMAAQQTEVVALESAILYESGFDTLVDEVLFVDAPRDVRLQRAMRRDGATEEQIRMRMERQQAQQNMRRARYIIDNNGVGEEELLDRLKDILSDIYSRYNH